jgi:hypothetical protein
MRKRSEYNVYPRAYMMSEEEEDVLMEEEEVLTDETEREEQEATQVALEGYTTVFDIKVTLTPVELVPLVAAKK